MFELIIIKFLFFIFWFSLSYYFYIKNINSVNLVPSSIVGVSSSNIPFIRFRGVWSHFLVFIFSLNFLELFIIIFTIHFLISFIVKMFLLTYFGYLMDLINIDINVSNLSFSHFMGEGDAASASSGSKSGGGSQSSSSVGNSSSNSKGVSSYNNTVDGVIMSAAVAGGFSMGRKVPSTTGKLALAAGGVVLGGAAIITKNISGNISKDAGKKEYLSLSLDDSLSQLFGLSGNSGLDLLIMINWFHKLEIIFIIILFYSLIIYLVPESYISWIETKIVNIFSNKSYLIELYFKSLRYFKKSSLIMIICSFILIVISNMYAYYYLSFYLDNYEDILRVYFSNLASK